MSISRIAVIGNDHGIGGSQTAFRRLVVFLRNEGLAVGAISLTDGAPTAFDGLAFHAPVRWTGGVPEFFAKAWESGRAARLCRRFDPNVFIAVGLGGVANCIARVLPGRTFTVCQDFISGRSPSDPALQGTMKSFDALAPQAPSMEKALRERGFDGSRLRWLPCFPEDYPLGSGHVPTNGGPLKLVYFGRIAPYKGVHLVVAAMQRSDALRGVHFDIWGKGATQHLQDLISLTGMADRIFLRGPYPSGCEGAELMSRYDALVLPTLGNEGLPLILLEGMSCGLPILATRVCAIPDCCEDNPDTVLAPPTEEGIQAGLEEVVLKLKAGEFSRERQRGYYEANFSYGVMAARWRDFLADPRGFFAHGD